MKLTPYVSTDTPPTQPGVYLTKREYSNVVFWRAFDGKNWRYGADVYPDRPCPSYQDALHKAVISGIMSNFLWCGLAENPDNA